MAEHMQRAVAHLKDKVLTLCGVVEESLWEAVKSIKTRDGLLAEKVIIGDIDTDHMEVDVEEECLKILALHQPVATDLRFIITVLKMNSELERIGDLAVNIAERSQFLASYEVISVPFDFETMASKTKDMLHKSLDALVNMDIGLAHEVLEADDEVDSINRQMYEQVKESILDHPHLIEGLIHLLSISRHLERIADHATNIAEDVIYMVEGRIVRHHAENYKAF